MQFLILKPLDKLQRKSYNTTKSRKHLGFQMFFFSRNGADFMTACLTTFRTGLPGGSSTQRTLYQFFRAKKHALDAISRKKLYPFAWGDRGRKFKSCHSDQKKQNRPCVCSAFSYLNFTTTSFANAERICLFCAPLNCGWSTPFGAKLSS